MHPRLIYTGIRVKDIDESIRFYCDVLGMRLVKREKTSQTNGEWAELRSVDSEQVLELNWYSEGTKFGTSYFNGSEIDHLAFDVENLDDWLKELESRKDVKILMRPREIGEWNEMFVEDPNGIWIEFLQRK